MEVEAGLRRFLLDQPVVAGYGVSRVVASCVVLFEGETVVAATCVVVTPFGSFRCSKVNQFPDRLELTLHRMDDRDVDGV